MLALGVEGGAMTGVEMGGILHHADGRLDGVDRRAAPGQDRPAGAQRAGEVGPGLGPFGLRHFGLRQRAAAAMDGKREGHVGILSGL